MKYKVGDKVRIKPKQYFIDNYEGRSGSFFNEPSPGLNRIMVKKHTGKIATITRARGYYRIDLDNGRWAWADWMLERGVDDSGNYLLEF